MKETQATDDSFAYGLVDDLEDTWINPLDDKAAVLIKKWRLRGLTYANIAEKLASIEYGHYTKMNGDQLLESTVYQFAMKHGMKNVAPSKPNQLRFSLRCTADHASADAVVTKIQGVVLSEDFSAEDKVLFVAAILDKHSECERIKE